jgi:hypothetical protein
VDPEALGGSDWQRRGEVPGSVQEATSCAIFTATSCNSAETSRPTEFLPHFIPRPCRGRQARRPPGADRDLRLARRHALHAQKGVAVGLSRFPAFSCFWLSPRSGTSFRRSSTREVVDALLGIRCRDGISRAGAGRRPGRTEADPGEVESDCSDGEEEKFPHRVCSSVQEKSSPARWCTDRLHSGTSGDPETLIVWRPISTALATARRLAWRGLRRRAEVGLNIAAWCIGTGSKSTGIDLLPSE